jgi:hypothetical protein
VESGRKARAQLVTNCLQGKNFARSLKNCESGRQKALVGGKLPAFRADFAACFEEFQSGNGNQIETAGFV